MATETIEKLKELALDGRYEEAAALLPEVKERNAKTVSEMMALAMIMGKTGDHERAEKLYLKAYKKRPSRLVLKDIMQMFIDCQLPNEAETYYNRYIDLTPGDRETALSAKYEIEKLRGTEAGYLIGLLQQLKELDYTEKYGYELCKQFYKSGDEEACRSECAELIQNFPGTCEAEKARKLVAVMNGEVSAEEIKKSSGMPAYAEEPDRGREISTKELPTIEFTQENEEHEEAERRIAESVQDIISGELQAEKEAEAAEIPETAEISGTDVTAETEAMPDTDGVPGTETAPDTNVILKEPADEAGEEHKTQHDIKDTEVPVRIYAECFTPQCHLGKEDFAETKSRALITEKKINVEEIFGQYFRNINMRRQIYNSLELSMISRENRWIIITGEEKTGRTYFGKRLIYCMYLMGLTASKKAAVTRASVVNSMDAGTLSEKTQGVNVIVEKATELTEEGVRTLRELKGPENKKICIILEDTDQSIAPFIKNVLPADMQLNNRIHFPKYNTEDLLGFAYDYVSSQGYKMEKLAADLIVSCINSTRAMSQGERFGSAIRVAEQSVDTADHRIAPEVLKMAVNADFQRYYSLTLIREDITP